MAKPPPDDPAGRPQPPDPAERPGGLARRDRAAGQGGPSLKARAVGYLSRREHSRSELARKLSAHCEDPAEIEAVLDTLQREGWQSDARYAQSLVHRRAAKQGTARILQELRQHGVASEQVTELRDDLRRTELERARAVWRKRFGGQLPATPADRARQQRFLAARGFTHEAIRAVLGKGGPDETEPDSDPDSFS